MFKTLVAITVLLGSTGCYGGFLEKITSKSDGKSDIQLKDEGAEATFDDYIKAIRELLDDKRESPVRANQDTFHLADSFVGLSMEEPCTEVSLKNLAKIVEIGLTHDKTAYVGEGNNDGPLDKILSDFADLYESRNCMDELKRKWNSGSLAKALEDTAPLDWLDAVNCPGQASAKSCRDLDLLKSALDRIIEAYRSEGVATAFTSTELGGLFGGKKVDSTTDYVAYMMSLKGRQEPIVYADNFITPCKELLEKYQDSLKPTADIQLVLRLTKRGIHDQGIPAGLFKLVSRYIMCDLYDKMNYIDLQHSMKQATSTEFALDPLV